MVSTENKTEHKKLPESMGKSWVIRMMFVYSRLWLSTYGRLPIVANYGKVGKLLKPYKDNFSEYQLALMLMQYFEWYGVSGDDDFVHRKLYDNAFPIVWFHNYADAIAVFLGETLDNHKEVEKLVDDKLSQL